MAYDIGVYMLFYDECKPIFGTNQENNERYKELAHILTQI